MDTSTYTKQTGTFLKADDIKKHPEAIFVILDEGEIVKSEKFGNERLHLSGEFNKEEKTLDCSKTNARAIEKVLGPESKKWIGKSLLLEVYKTKTSEGKLVDAINVKEVRI
jgi:hypothetical protein